jgi:drug/metabolite transporter (DMT)-like permease
MISLDNKQKGKLYAIVSAFTFAASGPIGKILQGQFSVYNMLFWRYFVASSIVTAIAFFYRKELEFNKKALIKAFITAAVFYSGSSALYFASFGYIGTGLSSAITFSHSLFVTIYVWVWDKQKITKAYIISFVLAVVGLGFILRYNNSSYDLYGIFMAIMSAIAYSIYIFCNRNKATNVSPLLSAMMLFYGNAIIFLFMSLADNSLQMPYTSLLWLKVLSIGSICTVLPIYYLLKALKYSNASDVTILSVFRPVFVLIMGSIFLNEHLELYQTIGITFILASGVIIQMHKDKSAAK